MYKTKEQALQAANQSELERGIHLWVYRCDYCGNWHLTHSSPEDYVSHYSEHHTGKPRSRKRGYKPRRR